MMKYDVFLSFRGEQTRKTFLSHLLNSFKKKGITTFTSSESSRASLQALQESLVAVPVISKDQASLDLWVDDLADIIECEKKGTLTAVPIFFQLDPCDVLEMLRTAGKKAKSMQEPKRKTLEVVKKWIDGHVINKSGFHSCDCKDDSELVGKVTSFASNILSSSTSRDQTSTGLSPARSGKLADAVRLDPGVTIPGFRFWRRPLEDYPEIMRSLRLKDLHALMLRARSPIIGVCGIEGVGKTSLVRHVYDEISPHFQHHFFVKQMIRTQEGISYKTNSLVTDLAREALKGSSFHGSSIQAIKEMIRHRKVLLVADGLDDSKQLKGLVKDSSWFGPGSRIIVITQDRSLLTECGVKQIYELDCPKHEEAIAFFSEFAFKQRNPLPDFEDLSFRAVQVSNRLPLALKMLGSFLRDKGKDEWVSTLSRLEASQNDYATEVCRNLRADDNAPRRPMKVEQNIGVDEENRFPFYRFALK